MFEVIPEIGIVDARNVINAIKEYHNYDFKDFALAAFKHRIEIFLLNNNIKNCELLIRSLRDKRVFDNFLCETAVEETEMFRDPSLWRILRDDIFPKEITTKSKYRIWLPFVVSGEELFSLVIVLQEADKMQQTEILASVVAAQLSEKIKTGFMNQKKLEISEQNYNRYQGTSTFTSYFTGNDAQIRRDVALIKQVQFFVQHITFDNAPKKVNMILFRNQMIYYNFQLKDTVLSILDGCLDEGGFLIIGFKETLKGHQIEERYTLVSESESIYRKKN